jgi:hypothetical protein
MPSGTFITTGCNSYNRVNVAGLAGSVPAKAAGDDCLEVLHGTLEEGIASYKSLGFTLRGAVPRPDGGLEFCSHTFFEKDGVFVAKLSSWPKALFTSLSKSMDPDRFHDFEREVRHDPDKNRYLRTLVEHAKWMPGSELFRDQARSALA